MKPIEQMTDEEMRHQIAETMGAKWLCHHGYRYLSFGPVRFPDHYSPKDYAKGDESIANEYFEGWDIPSYLTSLDAMHEAEKMLTAEQLPTYHDNLVGLVKNAEVGTPERWVLHATARQRALAFLATIRP